MDTENAGSAPNARLNTAARIGWGALILITLAVCYFGNLGAIGFVGPDEPRYAWIAREMAETGDWITPRLYGKPWFEKPVFYYWMAGASFKLFGVSEASARLPSALCALLATLALAGLAWRVYGAEIARWLLLLLPTSIGMIGFSHAAATDMPFSAMLTMAMASAAVLLGLARNEQTPVLSRAPWLALLLFGFFLGLAVLAKGPAAIILSGGGVFFWALFTKKWPDAFRLLHPVAIASFCATSLPWYILCARRNPDFFRVFIIEHNFKRYLTPEFQHIQPFWYYLPVLLAALFPWLAVLIWGAAKTLAMLRRRQKPGDLDLLLLCFAGFCILFFSTSRSKLPGYILPAIPAIGLLLARHWASQVQQKQTASRWIGAIGGVLLIGFGILFRYFGSHIHVATDVRPAQIVSYVSFLAVFGGMISLLATRSKHGHAAFMAMSVTMLAMMAVASGDLWQLDAGISARPAVSLARKDWPIEKLNTARVFGLRRDYVYSLQFYLHQEIPEWTPSDGNQEIIFTNFRGSEDLQKRGVLCPRYVVFPAVMICGAPMNRKAAER